MGQHVKNVGGGGGIGAGWPFNNQTRPILLPSYPLTYINPLKQSLQDVLSYRVHEVSADAA